MIGECVIRAEYPGDDPLTRVLHIQRADDTVLIADELLEDFAAGKGEPQVTFGDGIITIRAHNRIVSYGVTDEYDLRRNAWVARKAPEVGIPAEDAR